jgi:NAD(P)H-hydrate epimerase
VLDADALNIIASLHQPLVDACEGGVTQSVTEGVPLSAESLPNRVPLIFTPHPGELSRLTGIPVPVLLDDRIGHAQAFAKRHHIILNAKDTRSVITDGTRAYINPTGTSALAKGGSGDVLTGITAALAAQGCDALTAAALAAYLHGRAAEVVSAQMGVRSPLASEIANALGNVFEAFEIP